MPEFSAATIASHVLSQLECRRPALVGNEEAILSEVKANLASLALRYQESGLPVSYFAALSREIEAVLPARWPIVAARFTQLETRGFGVWRRGDLVARLVFLFGGFTLGGLCVAAPFIPIWEKWFPFALGIAAFWLPDVQTAWMRRRYARELGDIVRDLANKQPMLDAAVTWDELLPDSTSSSSSGGPRRS